MKYVSSAPPYMRMAYTKFLTGDDKELEEYLKKLSLAPATRRLLYDKQIGLYDFQSVYISQRRGMRNTDCIPQDCSCYVHIFGDSRVSGYMLEDKDLFTNILQKRLNTQGLKVGVLNYGIPGREIDRMEYQVKRANIKKGDFVFVLTACHEYRDNALFKQEQFAQHLKNIKVICDRKKAEMCYVNLPTTVEMYNPNDYEKIITELYKCYKFCEYSMEIVDRYKMYLFRLLMNYGIYVIDMANPFNLYRNGLLFINMHHYSPYGNTIIAEYLFDILNLMKSNNDSKSVEKENKKENQILKRWIKKEREKNSLGQKIHIYKDKSYPITDYKILFKYISREIACSINVNKKKIGAIVMNANPFTRGHRYLVESACREMDYLYIFVLSEDKSYFSFEDRFNMVCLGTSDIKNVLVIPSGEEIISSETFPEYFMKKEIQDAQINAYKDIESFALNIAPKYNIRYRFVGDEPLDRVTKQYNQQLQEVLPLFDISYREIQRYEIDEKIISASLVRWLFKEEKWDSLKKIVPQTTYEYLKNQVIRDKVHRNLI